MLTVFFIFMYAWNFNNIIHIYTKNKLDWYSHHSLAEFIERTKNSSRLFMSLGKHIVCNMTILKTKCFLMFCLLLFMHMILWTTDWTYTQHLTDLWSVNKKLVFDCRHIVINFIINMYTYYDNTIIRTICSKKRIYF